MLSTHARGNARAHAHPLHTHVARTTNLATLFSGPHGPLGASPYVLAASDASSDEEGNEEKDDKGKLPAGEEGNEEGNEETGRRKEHIA